MMRQAKRKLLRLLGVPAWALDVFFDPRRWSVTVTSHVIKQAGERYRQGDPKVIASDVLGAMCAGRMGDRSPDKRHRAWKATLAWSEDQHKVYVVKRRRRNWVVVTALPTAWSDREAELRVERGDARREHKITTKVAQAFLDAGWTR